LGKYENSKLSLKLHGKQRAILPLDYLQIFYGFLQSLMQSSSLCASAFGLVKFCPRIDLRFVFLYVLLNFYLATRSHKMTPHEGFIFFELVVSKLGST
jgi:hypothetical protein